MTVLIFIGGSLILNSRFLQACVKEHSEVFKGHISSFLPSHIAFCVHFTVIVRPRNHPTGVKLSLNG